MQTATAQQTTAAEVFAEIVRLTSMARHPSATVSRRCEFIARADRLAVELIDREDAGDTTATPFIDRLLPLT